MDLSGELERIALNATDLTVDNADATSTDTIDRWQKLFNFTEEEARDHISSHRSNISRTRISDEHWQLTLKTGAQEAESVSRFHADPTSVTYLLKLEGILHTPQKVQEAASISYMPRVREGLADESDSHRFCQVNGAVKARILDFLRASGHRHFRPTFVRVSASAKDLSSISVAPTLGVDATMPQHRLDSEAAVPGVLEAEFPVWYFFYGNLAKEDILKKLLSLPTSPEYHPAKVNGAVMKRWAGKYNAIIDGPASSAIDGWAYRVLSDEDESILRFHESENYEVVRCNIQLAGGEVKGLTFRYCGIQQHLGVEAARRWGS